MRTLLLLVLVLALVACTAEAAEPMTAEPEAQAPLSRSAADVFCADLLSEPLDKATNRIDRWALPGVYGPIVVACPDFAKGG